MDGKRARRGLAIRFLDAHRHFENGGSKARENIIRQKGGVKLKNRTWDSGSLLGKLNNPGFQFFMSVTDVMPYIK